MNNNTTNMRSMKEVKEELIGMVSTLLLLPDTKIDKVAVLSGPGYCYKVHYKNLEWFLKKLKALPNKTSPYRPTPTTKQVDVYNSDRRKEQAIQRYNKDNY